MTSDKVALILTFIAGVLSLAVTMLNPSPELANWLTFGVAVVNLALSVFFGREVWNVRQERKATALAFKEQADK